MRLNLSDHYLLAGARGLERAVQHVHYRADLAGLYDGLALALDSVAQVCIVLAQVGGSIGQFERHDLIGGTRRERAGRRAFAGHDGFTVLGGLFDLDDLAVAGEVIDADAYTGGFNLQIAFSTGYLAATAIAQAQWEI